MRREQILLRLDEISTIKQELLCIDHSDSMIRKNNSRLKEGISVIIPTYKGESVILKCLNSLKDQTLKKELFDVIIVINGEKDSTEQLVINFIQEEHLDNIILLYMSQASASLARNKGIEYAERRYTIFLDDDDYLSRNFLDEALRNSQPNVIAISQIYNVDCRGNVEKRNTINQQIIGAAEKSDVNLMSLDKVLTINACKLIPTHYLKHMTFDPNLKNGEDVAFFTEFFTRYDVNLKVIPIKQEVIYYRRLRENSVSRQAMSFEFNVVQRLEVISRLDKLLKTTSESKKKFIQSKINAQFSFTYKYLLKNKNEREDIIKEIKKYDLSYVPYYLINKGLATKLVISYCFPPYMDTSGNVMGKRIRMMNNIVDVIYNKMEMVRDKDYSLNILVGDLIENRFEIPSTTSFSSWKGITDFCNMGMVKIEKKRYKEIYSRAMWPASHFLAYQYKLLNPRTKWIAEFSDPILFDVRGVSRKSKIEDSSFIKRANHQIKAKYKLPPVNDNNLFFWCEYLPYIFADELVFTNINQLNYMINSFPVESIGEIIKEKAKISPHPTLPLKYYYVFKSDYYLDKEKVNMAYFGNMYKTRTLDDIFLGLKRINSDLRVKIKLHVFTNEYDLLIEEISGTELENCIVINPYVSYFEFLNLTTMFDCLIVNDSITKEYMPLNPYLPSKLSDYMGSGTKIWGIVEKDSILSRSALTYMSEVGDIAKAIDIIKLIISDKIPLINLR